MCFSITTNFDFLKGCVFRWEDFTATEGGLNHKQKRVPVLSSNEKDSDKEKLAANTVLKVYSRDRAKRLSKNNLEPEMNHTGLEEVHEGLYSDFEGDNS